MLSGPTASSFVDTLRPFRQDPLHPPATSFVDPPGLLWIRYIFLCGPATSSFVDPLCGPEGIHETLRAPIHKGP